MYITPNNDDDGFFFQMFLQTYHASLRPVDQFIRLDLEHMPTV